MKCENICASCKWKWKDKYKKNTKIVKITIKKKK